MKKIQLKEVLENYDEKASWAFIYGYTEPEAIHELHIICDVELSRLNDNDEIPEEAIHHIDDIASHSSEEWTEVAAETLQKIQALLHQQH